MKKPLNASIFTILFAILLTGCLSQKDFITESDYSYYGKFRKYKTYNFMKNAENDTLYHKELLEKTIASRMSSQGYFVEDKKPDLLIMYKLYEDDFSLRGYDQPNFESWVNDDLKSELTQNQSTAINPVTGEEEEFTENEYRPRNYDMHEGTLFVVFFDRKRKRTVWQGYASGVFSKQTKNSERNIKIATSKIFNEFRLVAEGYVIKGGS